MARDSNRKRFTKKSKGSFKKRVIAVVNSQAEKKNLDQVENATSIINSTQFLMTMVMPAQADDDNSRDGDQIRILSMRWRGHLELIGAATEGALIRFVLLRLPATNVDGSSPNVDFNNLLRPNDFYPRQLPYKYKVLHDKVYSIGGGGKSSQIITISKKLNELIQFDGVGATDIANYKFHLYGQTHHTTASELSCDMNSRIIYTDG